MFSKQLCRLVGSVVVCILASPLLAVAQGRKNPRDFPDFTLCPINLGWSVDATTGTILPPPAQPIRPPARTFTATGTAAEIALVACDRGLTDDHPDGLDLAIRNFAVVRQDVYESHQVQSTFPDFTCYLANGTEDTFFRKVGSLFSPSVTPAVTPQTLKFPFFDDFSDLAASQSAWRLDGAEIRSFDLNEPGTGAFTAAALVLARVPASAGENSCSRASVKVRRLRAGQKYVIDFKWESKGIVNAPEIEMLTFVDTKP